MAAWRAHPNAIKLTITKFGCYTSKMQSYFKRKLQTKLLELLGQFPAVAILGPRQCGKSTLAKEILSLHPQSLYLDLERPSDTQKLSEPELYLTTQKNKLVCIDEIQRSPDLFPLLRSLIDDTRKAGQFLILGSASRELLKQSTESLAGRIAYVELTPFLLSEVQNLNILWNRGGFPNSFLAANDPQSYEWRMQFMRTFLEQDIPGFGIHIQPLVLRRFWQMCAHCHGQILNRSKIGDSLGVNHHTVQHYLDILEKTFILRSLPAFSGNFKKRLVKSPKIYLRDTGILHALLDLENLDAVMGHPVLGSSWEGFVIENILSNISPSWHASYYRTADGTAEVDLVLEKSGQIILVECKSSLSPKLSRGFKTILEDLGSPKSFVICPIQDSYPLAPNITATSLELFLKNHQLFSKPLT